MQTTNENLAEAPRGQFSTSIFISIVLGIVVAPVLYAFYLWLANFLPIDDAARVKSFTDALFKSLAAAIGVGGPLALYARSLLLTWFKGLNQPVKGATE